MGKNKVLGILISSYKQTDWNRLFEKENRFKKGYLKDMENLKKNFDTIINSDPLESLSEDFKDVLSKSLENFFSIKNNLLMSRGDADSDRLSLIALRQDVHQLFDDLSPIVQHIENSN